MGRLRTAVNALRGRPVQTRSLSYQDVWGTGGSTDLFESSSAGVLSLVPLYAAIRLIADQFAATPLHGYREIEGTRVQMARDPSVLQPVTGSRATWKTQIIMGLLTQGNGVGLHTAFDAAGYPSSTVWLDPRLVQCDDNPFNPRYWYQGRELKPEEFVHIPWLTPAGKVWGLSPLANFKQLWETGQAAQILARNFYDSGGVPSGHLKNTAIELEEGEATAVKLKFRQAVAGRDVLVTGNDWTYDAIGLPADQLAFVQSLKMSATQIASIYGIAPEDIGGEAASGLQYSTVEMNEIKLSTRTMRPWYIRVQDGLDELTPRGQRLRFNPDALIQADLKSRMEAHEIQLRTGLEILPEARAVENKRPLTDAEKADWQATYRPAPPAAAQTRNIENREQQ